MATPINATWWLAAVKRRDPRALPALLASLQVRKSADARERAEALAQGPKELPWTMNCRCSPAPNDTASRSSR